MTAAGAAGVGARVAIIEEHLMGGDCLNVGCVPSKALIRCARAAHEVSLPPRDKACTCLIIRVRHQQVVMAGLLPQHMCALMSSSPGTENAASWLSMLSANLVNSYVSLTSPAQAHFHCSNGAFLSIQAFVSAHNFSTDLSLQASLACRYQRIHVRLSCYE